jgi:hypothetical protein
VQHIWLKVILRNARRHRDTRLGSSVSNTPQVEHIAWLNELGAGPEPVDKLWKKQRSHASGGRRVTPGGRRPAKKLDHREAQGKTIVEEAGHYANEENLYVSATKRANGEPATDEDANA